MHKLGRNVTVCSRDYMLGCSLIDPGVGCMQIKGPTDQTTPNKTCIQTNKNFGQQNAFYTFLKETFDWQNIKIMKMLKFMAINIPIDSQVKT